MSSYNIFSIQTEEPKYSSSKIPRLKIIKFETLTTTNVIITSDFIAIPTEMYHTLEFGISSTCKNFGAIHKMASEMLNLFSHSKMTKNHISTFYRVIETWILANHNAALKNVFIILYLWLIVKHNAAYRNGERCHPWNNPRK